MRKVRDEMPVLRTSFLAVIYSEYAQKIPVGRHVRHSSRDGIPFAASKHNTKRAADNDVLNWSHGVLGGCMHPSDRFSNKESYSRHWGLLPSFADHILKGVVAQFPRIAG